MEVYVKVRLIDIIKYFSLDKNLFTKHIIYQKLIFNLYPGFWVLLIDNGNIS